MRRYSIEPRTIKYVKGYEFLRFARKHTKKVLDTGLDGIKTAPKKVLYKASEFLRNKLAEAVTKFNGNQIKKTDQNS